MLASQGAACLSRTSSSVRLIADTGVTPAASMHGSSAAAIVAGGPARARPSAEGPWAIGTQAHRVPAPVDGRATVTVARRDIVI